jgi:PPOX class probable F420-dependent enzyme
MEAAWGDAGMSVAERVAVASNRFYDSIRRDDARRAVDGEAAAEGFAHLEGNAYSLIVTYKRSGEGVPTPVWFGVDTDGRLYFRTLADAVKVKRIRRNPRVRVAPCTVRGKPLGPAAEGTARVLGADEEEHAEATIQSNYGLFRRVYEATGGDVEFMYVEVTPA